MAHGHDMVLKPVVMKDGDFGHGNLIEKEAG
jgi:hypothetical protein